MSPTTDLQKGERLVNVDLLMKSCSYKPAGPCTHEYHYTCQFPLSDREQYNGESVENFWPKPKHQIEGEPVDAKKTTVEIGPEAVLVNKGRLAVTARFRSEPLPVPIKEQDKCGGGWNEQATYCARYGPVRTCLSSSTLELVITFFQRLQMGAATRGSLFAPSGAVPRMSVGRGQ
ncbi:hypothetical protein B0H14DRAFT_3485064 [Mycena olivaceomarginata]|nr:hypothetical protein B0H14DRAFT_3485064 [Mycena olivaceomarginata]